jgi:predicted AAA+ superfamily ATPase
MRKLYEKVRELERRFPQVHVHVVVRNFTPEQPIELFAFWIFNGGHLAQEAHKGGGNRDVLFVLDPVHQRMALMVGYGLEPFLRQQALDHLLQRGGFPEPCLADDAIQAERWRAQYLPDLVREDVLEFSRVQEIGAMRLFVEVLRDRVGSPLSLASIARDLAISPTTLQRYLDILRALFIVFTVQPWHRNIARALLQSPKVYFFDTGLVRGGDGPRLENAVAAMLLKHVHWLCDARGRQASLHYVRTKDGAEVDFAVAEEGELTQLVECKWADPHPHRALTRFAVDFPQVQAVQIVRELRQEEDLGRVQIRQAAAWLAGLAA